MVWVQTDDNIEGGGTEFPRLQRDGPDQPWCRWVVCPVRESANAENKSLKKPEGEPITGVTFKPVPGNAVFWENFRPDGTGRGWQETWHAGLPVTRGTKIGLNIWSWGRLS
jgi:prolyl 4-hydroxylase